VVDVEVESPAASATCADVVRVAPEATSPFILVVNRIDALLDLDRFPMRQTSWLSTLDDSGGVDRTKVVPAGI
jgi:hypothetical protein